MNPLLESLSAAGMGLAIAGVYLNNHKSRTCFDLFALSNALAFIVHWQAGLVVMVLRDAAFLALAGHGYRKWSEHGRP